MTPSIRTKLKFIRRWDTNPSTILPDGKKAKSFAFEYVMREYLKRKSMKDYYYDNI